MLIAYTASARPTCSTYSRLRPEQHTHSIATAQAGLKHRAHLRGRTWRASWTPQRRPSPAWGAQGTCRRSSSSAPTGRCGRESTEAGSAICGQPAADGSGGSGSGRAIGEQRRANSAAPAMPRPARPPAGRPSAARVLLLAAAARGGVRSPAASPLLDAAGRHAASPPPASRAVGAAWRRGMAPGPAAPGGAPVLPAGCNRLQGALTACGSSWSARGRQCPVPPPSRAPSLLPRKVGLSQNSLRGRARR